jgi:RNA polymerase sigma factor (sigma-70 family)
MAETTLGAAIRHVRTLAVPDRDQTDGELLSAFMAGDQAAFAVLVRRHGPLVLGVCRRVVHRLQDAEDVFQAAFLLLARRAAAVRRCPSLAAWLHGVAYRMAKNAQRAAARRHRHEGRVEPARTRSPEWEAAWREVQTVLDDEVERLPAFCREPFVLCCLEHHGCAEVARRLGVKEGTVWSRLDTAKKRLRRRLAQRGVDLTAVLAAAALAPGDAAASVPKSLVAAAVQAAAPDGPVAGLVSATVTALVNGANRAMILNQVKMVGVLLLTTVGALGVSVGAATHLDALARADEPPAQTTPVGPRPAAPATEPTAKFGEGWARTIEYSPEVEGEKKTVTARWKLWVEQRWLIVRREAAAGDLEWQVVLTRATDGPLPQAQVDKYGNVEVKYGGSFIRDGGRWLRVMREKKTAESPPWPAPPLAPGAQSRGYGGSPSCRVAGWEVGDWYWAVSGPENRGDVVIRLQHKDLHRGHGYIGSRSLARMDCGTKMVQDEGDLLVAELASVQEVERALLVKKIRQEIRTKPAPALVSRQWFNAPDGLRLDKLQGKVVLLDFWGTWCGPCVQKLPQTEALHQKYKDRGLVVIGVHSANDSENVGDFLKEKGYTFPVVIDKGDTVKQYAVEAWPTYFLIDKSGKVAWGFEHDPPKESQIEELLR